MAEDERKGRFVRGRYVIEEEEAPMAEASNEEEKQPTVEDLIKKTSANVDMTIESVVILGKKLFMTEEGRDHIETKTREIGTELQKAVGEIADAAQRFMKKK
ncbi:hypothetical protein RJ53_02050 [Methanocalculus chunghsingensis]|uniref:Uncharacterized protein n=1 Tax=Methanocalculus chunghsingensis TaxID=156457 RepID=A0A8J7W4W3_9EURY|nr:hypothetical protein [Methanocalculus chunghsingensis]MBR1368344.1 hypothetical protein [Methanocalculus chunghsingensis]